MIFQDRTDAGQKLGEALRAYAPQNPVVLGLVRGGLVVAHEVSKTLGARLEPMIARKVGAPWQPEFGIGAVAPGGVTYVEDEVLERTGITRERFESLAERESEDIERRLAQYGLPPEGNDVDGKAAILVDDGLATGATAIAATRQLRKRGASHIVFAAPVCSCYGAEALLRETDAVVCLQRPRNMVAVGYWYADFSPTTDKEALALLHDTEYRRVS